MEGWYKHNKTRECKNKQRRRDKLSQDCNKAPCSDSCLWTYDMSQIGTKKSKEPNTVPVNVKGAFSKDNRTLTVTATRKWASFQKGGDNLRNFKLRNAKRYMVGFYSKSTKGVFTGFIEANYLVICDGLASIGFSAGVLLAPSLLF